MDVIRTYLKSIATKLARGDASEHTYRSTLEKLIEALGDDITATNEPKRIKCGAPDFIITKGIVPLGYIETKDIGKSLQAIEADAKKANPKTADGKQLKRYLGSLSNLIFTDYLEFRWFYNGEKRLVVRIAQETDSGKIRFEKEKGDEFFKLISAFLETETVSVDSPIALAKKMASIAQLIHDIILKALSDDDKGGNLREQMEGFKKVLIHDLSGDQFADMYAQTICYGLFAAVCNHKGKEPFTREKATFELPKTNPFLRKMFGHIAGPELDNRITWAVDDLARILDKADIEAIVRDFGKRTRREDPVVHFYESFLAAYNPNMRVSRGVYYTPEPVVSFIVRSVDHILKKDFGLKDGLADTSKIPIYENKKDHNGIKKKIKKGECHRVLILDPAVGTGTFLHGVIDHIHEHIVDKGQSGIWCSYVSEHLLPRLFGFELLIAPYAVAHMKLDLQLKELGYDFKAKERLRIYLTNTLEESFEAGHLPFANWIAEEANEAGKIKSEAPVMVILGNPPYKKHSMNMSYISKEITKGEKYIDDWGIKNASYAIPITKIAKRNLRNRIHPTFIGRLIKDYFICDGDWIEEKNPKWLQDDYVKFIRFAQWRIEQTGYGILAFITNHGYLDNPTFRGMRQSLMRTFDDAYILDLHGNAQKKEKCPDGTKDENVFDIKQGVAIAIYVKKLSADQNKCSVKKADLWGVREKFAENSNTDKILIGGKYFWLFENNTAIDAFNIINPKTPFYTFTAKDDRLEDEFRIYLQINRILKVKSVGIVTGNDEKAIQFKIEESRRIAKDLELANINIKELLFRPFDNRYVLYDKILVTRRRLKVMRHILGAKNIALISARSNKSTEANHFFCTNRITEAKCGERTTQSYIFPLYIYPDPSKNDLFISDTQDDSLGGRKPNLAPEFTGELSKKIKMKFVQDGKGDLKKTFGPEDVFNYIYAVFHSPTYRKRYAEFLKIDFPRLPPTSKPALFRALCKLGGQLVGLHLIENYGPEMTSYPIKGEHQVEKVRYTEPGQGADKGRVWINNEQYFVNVPLEVWGFHIGGYQVCRKWLKDRKGRKLSYDDIKHYQNIVSALSETIRIMAAIDKTIDKHGGWPIK